MDEMYTTVCFEYNNQKSFGIALIETIDDCTVILQLIPDVCPAKKRVDQLVKRCNELRLDPIHLEEVIEDFLAEE